MKKLIALSVLGIISSSAFSQMESTSPLSFRLGFSAPTNGTTKDLVSEFVGVGGQYKLRDLASKKDYMSSLELSVDYIGRGDFRHIPILLNYVGSSAKSDFFYSVGGGLGFIGRPDAGGTESIARFSYQGTIGLYLNRGALPATLEVKYFGSAATNVNSLGIYLGVKI
jgi:hypothetical protein